MAQEISRFWDYDEFKNNEYQADEFAEPFRAYFYDGLPEFGDNLRVYPGIGMQIKTNYGAAIVQGTFYFLKDDETGVMTHPVPAAHGSLTRIDRVVLRRDKSSSVSSIIQVYVPGTPAASPEPPPLTREGNIYEISLARIVVMPGTLSITAEMVIDERADDDLCGLAENKVTRDRIDALVTALAGKAAADHIQAMSTITGLIDALDSKAAAEHTQAISTITGLIDALAGKAATNHTQEISSVTGLIDALAGKLANAEGAVGSTNLATGAVIASKVSPGHVVGARFTRGDFINFPSGEGRIPWTDYDYNPDASHNPSYPTHMICKYAGVYTIMATAAIGLDSEQEAVMSVMKNGYEVGSSSVMNTSSSISTDFQLYVLADNISLNVNDYIEVLVSNYEDGDLYINAPMSLSMRRNPF